MCSALAGSSGETFCRNVETTEHFQKLKEDNLKKCWNKIEQNIGIIMSSLFRRKKAGKVFLVKISTMDAELEFSLDYKVGSGHFPFLYLCLSEI